jgi:hypothetical protein
MQGPGSTTNAQPQEDDTVSPFPWKKMSVGGGGIDSGTTTRMSSPLLTLSPPRRKLSLRRPEISPSGSGSGTMTKPKVLSKPSRMSMRQKDMKKWWENDSTTPPPHQQHKHSSDQITTTMATLVDRRVQEGSLIVESYPSWEFGKVKSFVRPDPKSSRNQKAAVHIQRYIRGWWARLQYKIAVLQFKLQNKDLLTWRALAKIKDKTQTRKEKMVRKLHDKHVQRLQKKTKEQRTTEQAQTIIQALRAENKKLREKNARIIDACRNVKDQNDRLSTTTTAATDHISILTQHAEHIQQTNTKLLVVEPQYRKSVEVVAEAVEIRRQYCLCERQMKLSYVKCIGTMVDWIEDKLKDKEEDLLDEIIGYVLDTEDVDHEEPLPERIEVTDPEQDKDRSNEEDKDSIDAHSIATYTEDD